MGKQKTKKAYSYEMDDALAKFYKDLDKEHPLISERKPPDFEESTNLATNPFSKDVATLEPPKQPEERKSLTSSPSGIAFNPPGVNASDLLRNYKPSIAEKNVNVNVPKVFKDIEDKLMPLVENIEPYEDSLRTKVEEIKSVKSQLDNLKDNPNEFNKIVPKYNDLIKSYKTTAGNYKKETQKANELRNEYNKNYDKYITEPEKRRANEAIVNNPILQKLPRDVAENMLKQNIPQQRAEYLTRPGANVNISGFPKTTPEQKGMLEVKNAIRDVGGFFKARDFDESGIGEILTSVAGSVVGGLERFNKPIQKAKKGKLKPGDLLDIPLGTLETMFSAFMAKANAVQPLANAIADGIKNETTKNLVKNYLPFIVFRDPIKLIASAVVAKGASGQIKNALDEYTKLSDEDKFRLEHISNLAIFFLTHKGLQSGEAKLKRVYNDLDNFDFLDKQGFLKFPDIKPLDPNERVVDTNKLSERQKTVYKAYLNSKGRSSAEKEQLERRVGKFAPTVKEAYPEAFTENKIEPIKEPNEQPINTVTADPRSRYIVNQVEKQVNDALRVKAPFDEKTITNLVDEIKDPNEKKRLEGLYLKILDHNKQLAKSGITLVKPEPQPTEEIKPIEVNPETNDVIDETHQPNVEKAKEIVREPTKPEQPNIDEADKGAKIPNNRLVKHFNDFRLEKHNDGKYRVLYNPLGQLKESVLISEHNTLQEAEKSFEENINKANKSGGKINTIDELPDKMLPNVNYKFKDWNISLNKGYDQRKGKDVLSYIAKNNKTKETEVFNSIDEVKRYFNKPELPPSKERLNEPKSGNNVPTEPPESGQKVFDKFAEEISSPQDKTETKPETKVKKQPYEMMREEYNKANNGIVEEQHFVKGFKTKSKEEINAKLDELNKNKDGFVYSYNKDVGIVGSKTHFTIVKQALKEGKKVPDEVLKEAGLTKNGEPIETPTPSEKVSSAKPVEEQGNFKQVKENNNEPELIQEAKKYKSAEEFIKNKATLYHGSDVDIDRFDISKAKKWNKFGHFFSPDKEAVKIYGNKINQAEVTVKNPKIITQKQWWDIRGEHAKDDVWFSDWKKELKGQGYDGLLVKSSTEQFAGQEVKNPEILVAFDDSQIRTKSQLTNIYNKAHGKENLTKEVKTEIGKNPTEENIDNNKEVLNKYIPHKDLDAEIKIQKLDPQKDADDIKSGYKYKARIDYPISLGENGNYQDDFVYKTYPTKEEQIKDIREALEDERKSITEKEGTSDRDENILKAINKALGKKPDEEVTPFDDSIAGNDLIKANAKDKKAQYKQYPLSENIIGNTPDLKRIQDLKNSLAEGESIIKSGKNIIGKRLSFEELEAVKRSVKNTKKKIEELSKPIPGLKGLSKDELEKAKVNLRNKTPEVIRDEIKLINEQLKDFDDKIKENPNSKTSLESRKVLEQKKDIREEILAEKLQPEETPKPKDVELETAKDFVKAPILSLRKSLKDYQGRDEKFSKQTYNRIVNEVENGTFNESTLPPVFIWKNPETNTYDLLAGHSRVEAYNDLFKGKVLDEYDKYRDIKFPPNFKREQFGKINAKIVEAKSIKEARKIAQQSNQGAPQSDAANVKYFRELRENLKTKKAIKQKASDLYGNNAERIIDYSYLNPEGKAFNGLVNFGKTQVGQSQDNLKNIAQYIGRARRNIGVLTNSHEDELFKWLNEGTHFKDIGKKEEFIDRVENIVNKPDFDATKPLNIANRVSKGYNQSEIEGKIKDTLKQIKDLENERGKPGTTEKRLKKITEEIDYLNKDLVKFKKQLYGAKQADLMQGDIFSEVLDAVENKEIDNDKLEEIEGLTGTEAGEFKSSVEAIESKAESENEAELTEAVERAEELTGKPTDLEQIKINKPKYADAVKIEFTDGKKSTISLKDLDLIPKNLEIKDIKYGRFIQRGEKQVFEPIDNLIQEARAKYNVKDILGPKDQTQTPEFKKWFGDSKVVDKNGEPLIVYHGTTHNFDSFTKERGNTENDFGKGYYFTNGAEDVSENYAGEGQDLVQRIELLAERVQQDSEYETKKTFENKYGVPYKKDMPIAEATQIARGKLSGGSPNIMPVYLSIQNPVIIEDPKQGGRGTYLEYTPDMEYYEDMAKDEISKKDYPDTEEYNDAIKDKALEIYYEDYDPAVFGNASKMVEAINGLSLEYGIKNPLGSIFNLEEGIYAKELVDLLKADTNIMEATDEEGNLVGNEFIRRMFEDSGFDGIIDKTVNKKWGSQSKRFKTMAGMDYGTTHYVVFSPTQIKSAIGNKGTFDINDANILNENRVAYNTNPVFYSKLEKVIKDKAPNRNIRFHELWREHKLVDKNGNKQVRYEGLLAKEGVKKEEIDWMGLEEYLKEKPRTKKDVLDFLRANQLEVKTITKKEDIGRNDYDSVFSDVEEEFMNEHYDEFLKNGEFDDRAFDEVYRDEINREVTARMDEGIYDNTKYFQYTLPGGTNYREKLYTLPFRDEKRFEQLDKEIDVLEEKRKKIAKEILANNDTPQNNAEYKKIAGQIESLMPEWTSLRFAGKDETFTSPHWEEPNVFAHARIDDRNNGKTLFIEEVQSDQHREGRQKGYKGEYRKGELDKLQKEYAELLTKKNLGKEPLTEAEQQRLATLPGLMYRDQVGAVPNAPFKKSWHQFLLKNMLREAVEKGYDEIGWTTGKQQAERYDLSKQVDSIGWERDKDGSYTFTATKNGEDKLSKTGIAEDKLKDYLGKDIAEKIIKDNADNGLIEGRDLKIGGVWAKNLYDKTIPNFLNKYTKKWDGKVSESEINTGDENKVKVHSLKITPKMRESVIEGQPLFEPRAEFGDLDIIKKNKKFSEEKARLDEKKSKLQSDLEKLNLYRNHLKSIEQTPEVKKEFGLVNNKIISIEKSLGTGGDLFNTEGKNQLTIFEEKGTLRTNDEIKNIFGSEAKRKETKEAVQKDLENGRLPVYTGENALPEQRTEETRLPEALSKNSVFKKWVDTGRINIANEQLSDNVEQDIADIFKVARNPKTESFFFIGLDKGNKIIGNIALSSNASDYVKLSPEKSIEAARILKSKGAVKIIILHNHPSGDSTPSRQDKTTSLELKKAIEETGVDVKSSVVINGDKFSYWDIVDGNEIEKFGKYKNPRIHPQEELYKKFDSLEKIRIKNKHDAAEYFSKLKYGDGIAAVVVVDPQKIIRGYEHVSINNLKTAEDTIKVIEDILKTHGGASVFIVKSEADVIKEYGKNYQTIGRTSEKPKGTISTKYATEPYVATIVIGKNVSDIFEYKNKEDIFDAVFKERRNKFEGSYNQKETATDTEALKKLGLKNNKKNMDLVRNYRKTNKLNAAIEQNIDKNELKKQLSKDLENVDEKFVRNSTKMKHRISVYQKTLLRMMRDKLPDAEYKRAEVQKLAREIEKANTLKQLNKSLYKVENITEKVRKRKAITSIFRIIQHIGKVRKKGIVDDNTFDYFHSIRKVLTGKELNTNDPYDMFANDLLSGYRERTADNLENVNRTLKEMVDKGRDILKEIKEENKKRVDEIKQKLFDDMGINDVPLNEQELRAKEPKAQKKYVLSNFATAGSIFDKITTGKKDVSDSRMGDWYRRESQNALDKEYNFDKKFTDKNIEAVKRIFGSLSEMNRGQMQKKTGIIVNGTELVFSKDELAKKWIEWTQPYSRNILENKMNYTQEDIDKIGEYIGDKWREYAIYIRDEFLPSETPEIDKAFREINHIPLPQSENYISSKAANHEIDITDIFKGNPLKLTPGSWRHRVGNNELAYESLTDMVHRQVKESARGIGFSKYGRDIMSVLNDKEVKNAFRLKGQSILHRRLLAMIKNEINGRVNVNGTTNLINRIQGNITRAILVMPKQIVKQFTSLEAFAFRMPRTALYKGVLKELTHPKQSFDWVMENMPALNKRIKGGFSDATQEAYKEFGDMISYWGKLKETAFDKAPEKWREFILNHPHYKNVSLAATKIGDIIPVVLGAKSAYEYKYKELLKTMDKEAAHKEAVLWAEGISNDYQQSPEIRNRAFISQEGGSLGQVLAKFKQSSMAYFQPMWGLGDLIKTNPKTGLKAILTYIELGILFTLASNPKLLKKLLDGDDSAVKDVGLETATNLANLPVASDVAGLVRFYEQPPFYLSPVSKAVQEIKKKKNNLTQKALKSASELSQYAGLPIPKLREYYETNTQDNNIYQRIGYLFGYTRNQLEPKPIEIIRNKIKGKIIDLIKSGKNHEARGEFLKLFREIKRSDPFTELQKTRITDVDKFIRSYVLPKLSEPEKSVVKNWEGVKKRRRSRVR